jgi:hypothetical protein
VIIRIFKLFITCIISRRTMPSVLLVDCSLSMLRTLPQPKPNDEDEITHFQLASLGVNVLLDYLELDCKLEFVSLVITL